jgi:hypothetical protein
MSHDPRGPNRRIVAVGEIPQTNHVVTLDCGHKPALAQHFHYKVGNLLHCFACGQLSDVSEQERHKQLLIQRDARPDLR